MAYEIGDMIANRYKIIASIGEGAMGVVYKVEHTLMRKIVALKVLHPHVSQQNEIVERFQREAQAASAIEHQNICAVTEFDYTAEGNFFLVMEYLEGETLQDRIQRLGALPPITAISIAVQALSALQKAHEMGIVHRDIKPENVFLIQKEDEESFVKILDFGIARNSAFDGDHRLTQTGMIYGTPQYLSPEQATGSEVGLHSDLYSIGVILYEMLSGKPPFIAENLVSLLHKHISEKPPTLRSQAPQLEGVRSFDNVIQKLLKKTPEERYQSADEVIEALGAISNQLGQSHSLSIRMTQLLADKQGNATPAPATPSDSLLTSLPKITAVFDTLNKSRKHRLLLSIGVLLIIIGLVGTFLFFKPPKDREYTTDSAAIIYPQEGRAGLAKEASEQEFHYNIGFVISKDPSLVKSRNLVAGCEHLFLGQWEEARDSLDSEFEIFQKNPNYLKLLAFAFYKSGEIEKALLHVEKLLQSIPDAAQDDMVSEVLMEALIDKDTKALFTKLIKVENNPWLMESLTLSAVGRDVRRKDPLRDAVAKLFKDSGADENLPDWLKLSLELRLNDTTSCRKREEIIKQMLELGDARAWVAIEPFSRVGKKGCKNSIGLPRDCHECIRGHIDTARKQFTASDAEENP